MPIIAEHDASFGESLRLAGYFGQGEGTTVEYALRVLDETGAPIKDPTRKFRYRYEVWAWNEKTKKGEPFGGEGTASPSVREPGVVRFKVKELLRPDIALPPGGKISVWFLPAGAEDKPENYVEIIRDEGVVWQKAPAAPTKLIALRAEPPSAALTPAPADTGTPKTLLYALAGVALLALGIFVIAPALFKEPKP